MTVRVLISENHAALRSDLRALLRAEPDIEVVGEAQDLATTWRQAAGLRPDIVLLDINMPDLHGFAAITELGRGLPGAHILLLLDGEDQCLINDALAAGAAGCVIIQGADSTLAGAIRRTDRPVHDQ